MPDLWRPRSYRYVPTDEQIILGINSDGRPCRAGLGPGGTSSSLKPSPLIRCGVVDPVCRCARTAALMVKDAPSVRVVHECRVGVARVDGRGILRVKVFPGARGQVISPGLVQGHPA